MDCGVPNARVIDKEIGRQQLPGREERPTATKVIIKSNHHHNDSSDTKQNQKNCEASSHNDTRPWLDFRSADYLLPQAPGRSSLATSHLQMCAGSFASASLALTVGTPRTKAMCLFVWVSLPLGSIVYPFWDNLKKECKPQKGTTMEPMGRA